MNKKHLHKFKAEKHGTVAICQCGRFKFIGAFTPIVGVTKKTIVRKELIAHLRDYVMLQAQIWPEVLAGNDPVYNRAKATLDALKGAL
jgi:hypothetical protein